MIAALLSLQLSYIDFSCVASVILVYLIFCPPNMAVYMRRPVCSVRHFTNEKIILGPVLVVKKEGRNHSKIYSGTRYRENDRCIYADICDLCEYFIVYLAYLLAFYAHQGNVVTWKMRAPEKKPLVNQERPDEVHANVHRAEQRKNIEPIKALSEFHA